MTKEVDLVSYLPPYLAEFKEISVALEAENPEFVIVWNAADRVLYNEFIATADEYGISRFEKILNILPSKEDTLESRRARVQARWFNTIPYTMITFFQRLAALCGDTDFKVTKKYNIYQLEILTDLELFGQVEELDHMIDTMIPCNIITDAKNIFPCNTKGFAFIAGGVVAVEYFFITNDFRISNTISGNVGGAGGVSAAEGILVTNDFKESYSADGKMTIRGGTISTEHFLVTNDGQISSTISGGASVVGVAVATEKHFVTNDSKESLAASGSTVQGGGAINAVTVVITNDFNEQFNIKGENTVTSGVVAADTIEIN